MTRRTNDKYDTPMAEAIFEPIANLIPLDFKTVFEPCAGDGNLAAAIARHAKSVIQDDLLTGFDATKFEDWADRFDQPHWTITNPPFDVALPIIENAWEFSLSGIAFLLPITWAEPCGDRRDWLLNHADNLRYVIPISPRPKFREGEINPKTGKAYGTDPRTVCWYVWVKDWSWLDMGIVSPFQYLTGWR